MKKNRDIIALIWLSAFAVAMGYLETSVVVYLRKIYYPDGFDFPLSSMDSNILVTEVFREAATLIMIIAAGVLSGRNKIEKFGNFIYTFAIWDIFYYFFLWLLIDWPESLLTWDILFLIPVLWSGPVAGPIINSFTMIILAALIIHFTSSLSQIRIKAIEWLLLISGSLVIILSYTLDYLTFILQQFQLIDLIKWKPSDRMLQYSQSYVPETFNWWLFIVGELIIIGGIILFTIRNKNALKKLKA